MEKIVAYEFTNTASCGGNSPARVAITGAGSVALAAATVFGGPGGTTDPEELFVASVNTCIMMSFAHFARKFRLTFTSYESSAVGVLEKDEGGFRFTKVTVDTTVAVPKDTDESAVRKAAELAEKHCLVTRSLNCPVIYNLTVNAE